MGPTSLTYRSGTGGPGQCGSRVLQPTLGLLCAEAFGKLSFRSTWMYVTDGGHYDNLGLVEALRRGANRDRRPRRVGGPGQHLVNAWQCHRPARSDAGVQVTLNPTTMWTPRPGRGPGQPSVGLWHVHAATALPVRDRPYLGLQARLVGRRSLGRPGLRQGPLELPD